MPEEGAAQVAALRPTQSRAKAVDHVQGVFDLEVSEFLAFDVAPQGFDRVEVRSVSGEPLDPEPPTTARQVARHFLALVGVEAVPDQGAPRTEVLPENG